MRLPLILAALVHIQPIVSEDVLEPSVRNEVDHALSLAATAMSTNAAASVTNPIAITSTTAPATVASSTNCAAASVTNPIAITSTNALAAVAPSTNSAACDGRPVASQEMEPVDVFGTNGLSATAIAIKLVSSQRADGRWLSGTNDVTDVAVKILLSL